MSMVACSLLTGPGGVGCNSCIILFRVLGLLFFTIRFNKSEFTIISELEASIKPLGGVSSHILVLSHLFQHRLKGKKKRRKNL